MISSAPRKQCRQQLTQRGMLRTNIQAFHPPSFFSTSRLVSASRSGVGASQHSPTCETAEESVTNSLLTAIGFLPHSLYKALCLSCSSVYCGGFFPFLLGFKMPVMLQPFCGSLDTNSTNRRMRRRRHPVPWRPHQRRGAAAFRLRHSS